MATPQERRRPAWQSTRVVVDVEPNIRAAEVSGFICKRGFSAGNDKSIIAGTADFPSSYPPSMHSYIGIYDPSEMLEFRIGLLRRETVRHPKQIAGLYFGGEGRNEEWTLHVFASEKFDAMRSLAAQMTGAFGITIKLRYSPIRKSVRYAFPFVIPEADDPHASAMISRHGGNVIGD